VGARASWVVVTCVHSTGVMTDGNGRLACQRRRVVDVSRMCPATDCEKMKIVDHSWSAKPLVTSPLGLSSRCSRHRLTSDCSSVGCGFESHPRSCKAAGRSRFLAEGFTRRPNVSRSGPAAVSSSSSLSRMTATVRAPRVVSSCDNFPSTEVPISSTCGMDPSIRWSVSSEEYPRRHDAGTCRGRSGQVDVPGATSGHADRCGGLPSGTSEEVVCVAL
jgi:hypothetical protein